MHIRDIDFEDRLRINELKDSLKDSKIIGRDIIYFDTLSSTNTYAMKLSENGCKEGIIIISNSQSSGKGRFDRTWVSPPNKNLYMSIILKPYVSPEEAAILSLMTAVSCVKGLRKISTINTSIKWPNDIVVNDKKLGGILIETRSENKKISIAVIGIGINVNFRFCEMPEEIREIATSLKEETGLDYPRTEVVSVILKELDIWYNLFLKGNKEKIIDEWIRHSSTIEKHIRVKSGNFIYSGIAVGVDEHGRLLLKDNDSIIRISSGDVTVLR